MRSPWCGIIPHPTHCCETNSKGPGSKQAGLAMAFKLLEAAEQRWRAVNGPHLVALVRAGAVFQKGVLIARPGQDQEAAA